MSDIIGVKIPGIWGDTFVLTRRDAWEGIIASYQDPVDHEANTEDGSVHVDLTSLAAESEIVYDPEEGQSQEICMFIENHENRSIYDALCNELAETWDIYDSLGSGDVYNLLRELGATGVSATGRGFGINQASGFFGKKFFTIDVDDEEDAYVTVEGQEVGCVHYTHVDKLREILSAYKVEKSQ